MLMPFLQRIAIYQLQHLSGMNRRGRCASGYDLVTQSAQILMGYFTHLELAKRLLEVALID